MPHTVAVAASTASDTEDAVGELRRALGSNSPSFVLVFHSPRHDSARVAKAVAEAFPMARTAGCSTTGEIFGGQLRSGSMSALAFSSGAQVAVEAIPDLNRWRFADGPALMGRLAADLGTGPRDLRPNRDLLIVLADGLSGGDELLLSALCELAPGLDLVGANAADDNHFRRTWTFCDGVSRPDSAVVALVQPNVPFRPFAVHHYRLRGERVIVTRSDPARRRISELNGFPAVDEFCRIAGLDVDAVRADPDQLAAQPVQLAVRFGDTWHIRGVMTMRDDDLILAGSVEDGAILEVAEAGELIASTISGLEQALDQLPGAAQSMLLFNCGGRVSIARHQDLVQELGSAMCPLPATGMSTYGELYGANLVNFTLTGVVFGLPELVHPTPRGTDGPPA